MISLGKLVASVAFPLALGAGGAEVASDEHIRLIMYLSGTVAATVTVVTWVRREIRKETDAQTIFIMREFRHFRSLLAVRFGAPELAPEPETTGEIELSVRPGKRGR